MWLIPILVLLGWSMPLTLSSKSAKLFKSPKLSIYETRHSYHDTSKSSSSKRLFSTKKSASKSFKHEMNPSATSTDDEPSDAPTDSPTKAHVTDEPAPSHNTDEPTYEPTSVVIIEETSVPTPEPTSSPETLAPTPCSSRKFFIITDMKGVKKCSNGMDNVGDSLESYDAAEDCCANIFVNPNYQEADSACKFIDVCNPTGEPSLSPTRANVKNNPTLSPVPAPVTLAPIESKSLPVSVSPTSLTTARPSSTPETTTSEPIVLIVDEETGEVERPADEVLPTLNPTYHPTNSPSTMKPTSKPIFKKPTDVPTHIPTTYEPSSDAPSTNPSEYPTSVSPTYLPTGTSPTSKPTSKKPSSNPSSAPATEEPNSDAPSPNPSDSPTSVSPTGNEPSLNPTTKEPTPKPTTKPISAMPSESPTLNPVIASPTLSQTIKSSSEISLSMYTETADFFSMSMEVLELSMPVYDNVISISMGAIEIPLELDDLRGEITSEPTSNEPTINPTYEPTTPWPTFELTSSPIHATTKFSNRPSWRAPITDAPTSTAPTSDLFSMSMEVLELSTPVFDNEISISMSAMEILLQLNDLITSEPTTSSSSKPTQKILETEPPHSQNIPTSAVPTSTVPTSETSNSIAPTLESSMQSSTNPSILLPSSSAKPTTIATPTATFNVNFQVITDMPSTTQVVTATTTDLLSNQDQIVPPQATTAENKFVSIDPIAVITVTILMLFMLTVMLGLLVGQKRQMSSTRDDTYISMNNSGLIQADSIVDNEQDTNIFEILVDRESSIRTIASEVRNKNRQSGTSDLPLTTEDECATSIIRPIIPAEEDIKYKNIYTQCGMLQKNLCVSPTNRSHYEPPVALTQCEEYVSMYCSSPIIRPSTSEATDELLPVDVVYAYTEAPHSKKKQVPPSEGTEDE